MSETAAETRETAAALDSTCRKCGEPGFLDVLTLNPAFDGDLKYFCSDPSCDSSWEVRVVPVTAPGKIQFYKGDHPPAQAAPARICLNCRWWRKQSDSPDAAILGVSAEAAGELGAITGTCHVRSFGDFPLRFSTDFCGEFTERT